MASISEPPGGKPAVAKAGTSPGSAVEALQVVHNADGSTALTIPIRGSLSNLNRYPLANPDGFVVKLPHARPKIPFADYRLHDGGFRVVWVRAHEEGVQLRFLFSKPTRPHEVKVVNGRVVVTLQPPPEQLTDEEPT